MKLVFSIGHLGMLRIFEPGLRELAARGHRILVTYERPDQLNGKRIAAELTAAHPGAIEFRPGARWGHQRWHGLGRALRSCLDYLRYLDPRYAHARKLTARGTLFAPRWLVRLTARSWARGRLVTWLLASSIRALERGIPPNRAATSLLESRSPHLLAVSPMVYFRSDQVDYVRAARRRGLPVALCVGSWDHLTTKGLIHELPDWVTVWNRAQRMEAVQLHGVPPDRALITGAQVYDRWFDRDPALDRELLCARTGLDVRMPFILYICSSEFIAPGERRFIERWLKALRESSARPLQEVGVLIRPHPQNADQWQGFDAAGFENVTLWPHEASAPVDARSRDDYYDSIFHSHAVVGVNTSGMVEAGILGKPVHTVLAAEFADTQRGTLHFEHLVSVGGGLLHVGEDLDEHLAQLEASLRGPGRGDAKAARFVREFVRPRGLDIPASSVFAETLEACAAAVPDRQGATDRAGRALVYPLLCCIRAAFAHRLGEPAPLERQRRLVRARVREARSDLGLAWWRRSKAMAGRIETIRKVVGLRWHQLVKARRRLEEVAGAQPRRVRMRARRARRGARNRVGIVRRTLRLGWHHARKRVRRYARAALRAVRRPVDESRDTATRRK